jgi:hypothetical protein
MKKGYSIPLVILFALTLAAGITSSPCLAAEKGDTTTIHKDGTAFVKESRVTQAERQAAANRAKAKGFVAPKVMDPATTPSDGAPTEQNPANNGGPAK